MFGELWLESSSLGTLAIAGVKAFVLVASRCTLELSLKPVLHPPPPAERRGDDSLRMVLAGPPLLNSCELYPIVRP